jgi:hypothetical protein
VHAGREDRLPSILRRFPSDSLNASGAVKAFELFGMIHGDA